MGATAAETAARSFSLNRQVEAYLAWYEEILEASKSVITSYSIHYTKLYEANDETGSRLYPPVR